MYLLKIYGPLTEKKLTPHCFAIDDAIIVFPQPGGPYSKRPLLGRIYSCLKSLLNLFGRLKASLIAYLAEYIPPI